MTRTRTLIAVGRTYTDGWRILRRDPDDPDVWVLETRKREPRKGAA